MGVIIGRLTTCVSCRSRAWRMEYGPAEWNKIEEELLDACAEVASVWCGYMSTLEKSGDCFGQITLVAAEF